MTSRPRVTAAGLVMCAGVALQFLLPATGEATTTWSITLHASSSGEAQSRGGPTTPASVTASCSGSLLSGYAAALSWPSVTNATGYDVYESVNSGSYTLLASAVTSVSYTTANLADGSYAFEVAAMIGSNWLGAKSPASATVSVGGVLGLNLTCSG
ncbi:MAG: hypothetical protein ACYDD4_11685 [Acidimicrobiales bacterium]